MKNTIYFLLPMLLFLGCKKDYISNEPTKPKTTIKTVSAIQLKEQREAVTINASGVLISSQEVKFSFKIGGIVKQLNFEEGQQVRKGQVLSKLDLVEIDAQVLQAQNAYEKAVRDLKRIESLLQDSVATLEQKQDANTAVEIAKASLKIANFNQRYATIIAPMDGKVLKKMVEKNELVSPGQPIYVIGSTGSKGSQVLKIGVADKQIVKISPTDEVSIEFSAFPNKKYPAKVSEIAEEGNPFTGTFDVELSLDGFFSELKNGFVGYVEILPSSTELHYRIPMTALVEGDDRKASIFISPDGATVEKRMVEVNQIEDDFFMVDATELQANQWLIIEGAAYLSEKDSINIIQ